MAIVGGGITGLSAALHLAEAGIGSVVLESRQAGWGASGRAFGQVVPYLKHDTADILRHYDTERGERVAAAVAEGPSRVAALIERYGIDCDLQRSGLIFGGHSPSGEMMLRNRADYWRQRGAKVELLQGATAESAIGSHYYRVALLDHRGVHLNPFAYTNGLARAAQTQGTKLVTGVTVQSLRQESGLWVLTAERHTVRAEAAILATNAYSDGLWPGLAGSIVPMRGHGMVSAPLSDNLRRSILPGGQALTDTRRLFSGVRVLADGRLHASLDGPAFGPEADGHVAKLKQRLARLYPQLGPVQWEEAWSGFIALTPDQFPRVHILAPRLFAGLGYSGRGIAAATMIGAELAARVQGVGDQDLVFPATPLQSIAGRRFAEVSIAALVNWYRVRDAVDERRHGR
ncbi:MAG TPA: FAD-dependent oxidoreductase [Rhodopila sp.]|nr:FAD-dependent oxidoreductase [Rhodopila sp.]